MKCKDCNACEKGFFKSKPDAYVCIGVSEPFIIKDINNECTEYPEKNKEDTPMREILFRAKLKDWKTNPKHNRWVEGFYLKRKETTYCFTEDYENYPVKTLHFIAEECMTDWGLPNDFRLYEIDPDTLCQFTGINDKENNMIWENDIIKGTFWGFMMPIKNHVFKISWHDDVAGWYRNVMDEDNVVIGNIFDNPKLLESK